MRVRPLTAAPDLERVLEFVVAGNTAQRLDLLGLGGPGNEDLLGCEPSGAGVAGSTGAAVLVSGRLLVVDGGVVIGHGRARELVELGAQGRHRLRQVGSVDLLEPGP